MTTTYISDEEAREYIGATAGGSDALIADVVRAVSRLIDNYCGRHFYQDGTVGTPAVRVFDTDEPYSVQFGPFNDLVSLSTLKTDTTGDGTFDTTWTSGQYQLTPVSQRGPYTLPYTGIRALGGNSFPCYSTTRRIGLVQVTGVFGWAEVPIEVKQSARILVAEVSKLKDAPLGIAGSDQFGMFRVPTSLPARVRQMLAPLVHPAQFGIA